MKVYSTDGSVLMEVQSLERNGNNIEFKGLIMGSMPVKGCLKPAEARAVFKLLKPSLILFLLTFLFRK
ncbi:MAG TPA: hypothetical protein VFM46_03880 [Pseudomonadales bacterium]|nr:hypothetical protein [Pseudomonadales bacterium]